MKKFFLVLVFVLFLSSVSPVVATPPAPWLEVRGDHEMITLTTGSDTVWPFVGVCDTDGICTTHSLTWVCVPDLDNPSCSADVAVGGVVEVTGIPAFEEYLLTTRYWKFGEDLKTLQIQYQTFLPLVLN